MPQAARALAKSDDAAFDELRVMLDSLVESREAAKRERREMLVWGRAEVERGDLMLAELGLTRPRLNGR